MTARRQRATDQPPPEVWVAVGQVSHATHDGTRADLCDGDPVPVDLFSPEELRALTDRGAIRPA